VTGRKFNPTGRLHRLRRPPCPPILGEPRRAKDLKIHPPYSRLFYPSALQDLRQGIWINWEPILRARTQSPLHLGSERGRSAVGIAAKRKCGLEIQLIEVKPNNVGNDPSRRKKVSAGSVGGVAAELGIASSTTVVTVADREADLYELFALERASHSHLLIRGSPNRRVREETQYLRQSLEQADSAGEFQLEVTPTPQNPARTATVTVRSAHLHILPPRNHPQRASFSPVPLNGILVTEENPPAHTEAIEWLLLTTLPVESFEEALLYVRWYRFRGLIERYHYVLKSGCRIEQLQLETADRIERALAT
jgi:hypothetical protein